jgi:flagellar assembly protein FliH
VASVVRGVQLQVQTKKLLLGSQRRIQTQLEAVASNVSTPSPDGVTPKPTVVVKPTKPAPPQLSNEELEALRTKSRKDGYDAGHTQGLQAGEKAFSQKLEKLNNLIETMSKALQLDVDALEDIAVDVAFTGICKVLGTSMQTEEGVRAAVGEALLSAKQHEIFLVKVSPKQYEVLKDSQEILRKSDQLGVAIKLVPDAAVVLGGCLIETAAGRLDARLETQLASLREVLISTRNTSDAGKVE